MGQLSQVAYNTRKIIKYGFLSIVIYLVSIYILKTSFRLWRQFHPPAPPPPNTAFGKLPKIIFPQNQPKEFSFVLETANGQLPNLENKGTVYALPPKKPSLLALDRAKELAKKLDFTAQPKKISNQIYRFSKQNPALSTLDYNLVFDTFSMQYSWQKDENILRQNQFSSMEELKNEAKQIIKQVGILKPDLDINNIGLSYFKANLNNLIPAVSLSEADFIRLDFPRTSPDKKTPIVYPQPQKANISLIFSGGTVSSSNKKIISLDYNYFDIDYNSLATYPLKSVTQAWEELKNNQAFVAEVKLPGPKIITIRKVFIAWYDSDKYQPYLQPVYVFQGDNNFQAYLPAISAEWIISE